MNTYDIFEGTELRVAEFIQRLRLQILVHSCIYYELNRSIIADAKWDRLARELVRLQAEYPDIAKKVMYAEAFEGFDGSTGFDLPVKDEWVINKAKQLCRMVDKAKKEESKISKKEETKKPKGGRLF